MVTYCTAKDVTRILMQQFKFDSSSTPTQDQVESFIESAEDEIDQRTQHSWRVTNVADEFYDLPTTSFPDQNASGYSYNQQAIYLRHRNLVPLDSAATPTPDKLEVWDGSKYDDWLVTHTEGRDKDYWFDEEQGILYLRYWYAWFVRKAIRLTYRYGETTVPKDIRDATATMAAIMLIQNDDRSSMLNETGDPTRMSYLDRITFLEKKVDRVLANRTDLTIAN